MPDIAAKALKELAPREIHIVSPHKPTHIIHRAHHMLESMVTVVNANVAPFFVGPAGSGKTKLARQCAIALDLPFYMAARVDSKSELVGYKDGYGKYHSTSFRNAYEHGGIYLLDEVTAGDPSVLTAFNAAASNDPGETYDFPDTAVPRHDDFRPIAADNTWGTGADRLYVGRNQLDASTIDRFAFFEIGYDENLEREIANHDEWVDRVQQVRRAVQRETLRVIISPRASIMGAKMLKAGVPQHLVETAVLFKGMDKASRARVER